MCICTASSPEHPKSVVGLVSRHNLTNINIYAHTILYTFRKRREGHMETPPAMHIVYGCCCGDSLLFVQCEWMFGVRRRCMGISDGHQNRTDRTLTHTHIHTILYECHVQRIVAAAAVRLLSTPSSTHPVPPSARQPQHASCHRHRPHHTQCVLCVRVGFGVGWGANDANDMRDTERRQTGGFCTKRRHRRRHRRVRIRLLGLFWWFGIDSLTT